jgi:hypothetical protein
MSEQWERARVHDRRYAVALPLLVFGACGLVGVSVDAFDIVQHLIDGPRWLNKLDLLTAVFITASIGCVDLYLRRRG